MFEPGRLPWVYYTAGTPDRIEIVRDGVTLVFHPHASMPETYVVAPPPPDRE